MALKSDKSKPTKKKPIKKVEKGKKMVPPRTPKVTPPQKRDLRHIDPKNRTQESVFQEFQKGKHLVLHGSAGTGKTFLSMFLALQEVQRRETNHRKVIIIRSVVPTREVGFLPGSLEEKISVYEVPYENICSDLYCNKLAYSELKEQEKLYFSSTSFVRGVTFDNAIIIVDECQNMTFHELDSIITRCGNNCKILFCGDWFQSDLKNSGFKEFMEILKAMSSFKCIQFSISDIVRSGIVREYILEKQNIQKIVSPL